MSRREIVNFNIDPFLRDFTHVEGVYRVAGGYNYQSCQLLIRDASAGILRPANVADFTLEEDEIFDSALFLSLIDRDTTGESAAFEVPVVVSGTYRLDSLILPDSLSSESRIANKTIHDLLREQGLIGIVVEHRSYVAQGDRG